MEGIRVLNTGVRKVVAGEGTAMQSQAEEGQVSEMRV